MHFSQPNLICPLPSLITKILPKFHKDLNKWIHMKFHTEHGSMTAVLGEKFHEDPPIKTDAMGNSNLVKFQMVLDELSTFIQAANCSNLRNWRGLRRMATVLAVWQQWLGDWPCSWQSDNYWQSDNTAHHLGYNHVITALIIWISSQWVCHLLGPRCCHDVYMSLDLIERSGIPLCENYGTQQLNTLQWLHLKIEHKGSSSNGWHAPHLTLLMQAIEYSI